MKNSTNTKAPVVGTWNVQKGKLKEKYKILNDEDLRYETSKKDEMLKHVQVKIGKTKEEFDALMASL
ncbi:MAG: general stress protein CsbD [Bacteroidetes bacterium]|nr:general stress protein CsbD [Bacteroidota bacterium]